MKRNRKISETSETGDSQKPTKAQKKRHRAFLGKQAAKKRDEDLEEEFLSIVQEQLAIALDRAITQFKEEERLKQDVIVEDRVEKESRQRIEVAIAQVVGDLLPLSTGGVHIHAVEKQPEYFKSLCKLEGLTNAPLRIDNNDFAKLDTAWIWEPGLHIGIEKAVLDLRAEGYLNHNSIVFMVRIRPMKWKSNTELADDDLMKCLNTLMNWTFSVPSIKTNSAHKKPLQKYEPELDLNELTEHGTPSTPTAIPQKKHGTMYGMGWHHSMEKHIDLPSYAARPSDVGKRLYRQCLEYLPHVASMFRHGLCTIHPGAYAETCDLAKEHLVPSFGDVNFDGTSTKEPFANCLTITRNDFANFLHRDKDQIPVAYGWWWAAQKNSTTKHFELSNNCDHDKIKGGAFLWGEYGIGVDFEKSKGLVEIFWRGMIDAHCTMQSSSDNSVTRFGTSIQLTAKGVNACDRFWKRGGVISRVVTMRQRANTKPKVKKRKRD